MKHIFVGIVLTGVAVGCSSQIKHTRADVSDTNVIAVVLGKKITAKDKDNLAGLIFGALFNRFAKGNKIKPTEDELNGFILKIREVQNQEQIKDEQKRENLLKELKSASHSDEKRKEKEFQLERTERNLKSTNEMNQQTEGMEKQLRAAERQNAQRFVRAWKINKALYEKYGGRVIFQQAGPEPLDAYRDFLKEQEKKGAFQILDPKYEGSFWRYFTFDGMHTFCSKEDGEMAMKTPWWLMEQPPAD